MSNKKSRGQFYTTNYEYILDGFLQPPSNARCVIEPFAGKGHLLNWLKTELPIEAYDIEPKKEGITERDTLLNPPDYKDAWIITNPPYLARNKNANKQIYDKYQTNDLYKCFLKTLNECCGGILIIPSGFFLSPRNIDVECRNLFLSQFRILKIKYFEEQVFADTSVTVVAFQFEKSKSSLTFQNVEWIHLPSSDSKIFEMRAEYGWIVGGEIYELSGTTKVRRHIEGHPLKDGEQQTYITLHVLDSGSSNGRIGMIYHEGYVYPAKESDRSVATLRVQGRTLTKEQQEKLCEQFNEFIDQKRDETWSLFLPQYREYGRKRIPFELAYTILSHLIKRI
jgi:hypothetical protein